MSFVKRPTERAPTTRQAPPGFWNPRGSSHLLALSDIHIQSRTRYRRSLSPVSGYPTSPDGDQCSDDPETCMGSLHQ
ncbi:hypothetical protein BDN71DRAFT_1452386 [Pleurotus eryngii]|uniref:Uncharacterized protein n=1 Tax=Pleurotus eryngii TaxID=5323 RepID=A0A9P6DDE6_PLEER|nr:hypothetical protein BDN71DRAFT_1452386 [Pleurotus eryngii]